MTCLTLATTPDVGTGDVARVDLDTFFDVSLSRQKILSCSVSSFASVGSFDFRLFNSSDNLSE